MRKWFLVAVVMGILSIGLLALARPPASAQSAPPAAASPPLPQAILPAVTPQPGLSQSGTRTQAPNALVSQTLSNPYCYQPDPGVDQCIINVRYYQATDNGTTAPFMIRAAISINGRNRTVENLFFENALYYTFDMNPGGLKVACGAPNAGGQGTSYGNVYLVKVEPLDSTGASMGYDQASLACPAFAP